MGQTVSSSLRPYALSLLRMVAGFTFTLHGLQLLFGFFGGVDGKGATAHFVSSSWAAGFLEAVGGPLTVLGLFTAPVSFVLSGEMAVAYFWFHFPQGFWPIKNGGELAILYCFVFLYLWTAGPGPLSADYLVRKEGR